MSEKDRRCNKDGQSKECGGEGGTWTSSGNNIVKEKQR